jgi:DNA-binding beta-propeller fold protein YncE
MSRAALIANSGLDCGAGERSRAVGAAASVGDARRGTRALAPAALCAALALAAIAPAATAADWIVSANDGKFVRVNGAGTYPRPAPPDSLALIDLAQWPPRLANLAVGIEHSIVGPPDAVAVTPDGHLAIVSAPSRYDDAAKAVVFDHDLQVVDLDSRPARLVARIDVGAQANGVSINPQGTLLLAAGLDGKVKVLRIDGKQLTLIDQLEVSRGRLAGISFTHDGTAALVALRDEGTIAVLDIDGGQVRLSRERVASGLVPYDLDISGDGHWAAVSNVGAAGMAGFAGVSAADAECVTLIDVSSRPFRAVQYLTVPSVPEGLALSPDGRWLAVQSMDGSNLAKGQAGYHARGKVTLFALDAAGARRVGELPSGAGSQGVVFSADSKRLVVQFDVEKQLAFYAIEDGRLRDTGQRLSLDAGPVSIRSVPR